MNAAQPDTGDRHPAATPPAPTDRPASELETDPFWRFERDGWERAAQHYDRCCGGPTRDFVTPLLDAVWGQPGDAVLDVACGPGYLAAAAERAGARVIAVDIATEVVRRAQDDHPHLDIRQADAHSLPFEDASFDVVASCFGVLHFADSDRFFAEARRVLRPGGRLGFTVWADDEHSCFSILARAVAAHGVPVSLPEGPPFFRFSSAAECERTLGAAGFTDLSFATRTVNWDLPAPTALFDALHDGAVRVAAVLRNQPPDRLEAIRTAMAGEVAAHRHGDIYRLPTDAHIVTASQPTA